MGREMSFPLLSLSLRHVAMQVSDLKKYSCKTTLFGICFHRPPTTPLTTNFAPLVSATGSVPSQARMVLRLFAVNARQWSPVVTKQPTRCPACWPHAVKHSIV